jgi:hypothetical protein
MENKEIVKLAIKSQAFAENTLDHVKLAQLAKFTMEEIEFVKLFWDPAFNNSWIYITKNMVIEWLGYKNSKDTMPDFYKILTKSYEKDIDYKEVKKEDEIITKFYSENTTNEKLGNRAKYYAITGECLKTLLMSAQTLRGFNCCSKSYTKLYIDNYLFFL